VIVVCDGINSTSRLALLSSGDQASSIRRSSGYSIHRAIIDSDAIARDPACSCTYSSLVSGVKSLTFRNSATDLLELVLYSSTPLLPDLL